MTRIFAVLAILASVPTLIATTATTAEAAPQRHEAFENSVKLEVKGAKALIEMWDTLSTKTTKWSEEARTSHDAGVALYKKAEAEADAGHYSGAYDLLADAWVAHSPATREAVKHAPDEAVEAVLANFIEAVEDRVGFMGTQLDGAPQSAKDAYTVAEASYDAAVSAHASRDRAATIDAVEKSLKDLHVAFKEIGKTNKELRNL